MFESSMIGKTVYSITGSQMRERRLSLRLEKRDDRREGPAGHPPRRRRRERFVLLFQGIRRTPETTSAVQTVSFN